MGANQPSDANTLTGRLEVQLLKHTCVIATSGQRGREDETTGALLALLQLQADGH
jgi:hypothetical protein